MIDSFQEFKEFKNIDRPTVITVLEEVFRSMIRKRFGTDENVDVIVNPDNGDLEIWRTRTVMEDGFSEDDELEIELTEVQKYDSDLEVGDDYIEEITLAVGLYWLLAKRWCRRYWSWRKMKFSGNIKTVKANSWWVRCIKYGRKKFWYWTKMATN